MEGKGGKETSHVGARWSTMLVLSDSDLYVGVQPPCTAHWCRTVTRTPAEPGDLGRREWGQIDGGLGETTGNDRNKSPYTPHTVGGTKWYSRD